MTVLHWNFVLLFIYAFLLLKKGSSKKSHILFIGLMTAQFILINGLRHFSVGIDSVIYQWEFIEASEISHIGELFTINRYEPGYNLLAGLIGAFTANYGAFFFVCALMIFIPLAFFIYRNSANYFLSYFAFIVLRLFDFSMNGLRQAVAMSIAVFAFEFAMKKKPWQFIGVVLFAALFHYSALIVLPIYILVNLKPNKYHVPALVILYFLFYFSRDLIVGLAYQLYYINTDSSFISHYETTTIGLMGLFIIGLVILGALMHNPLNPNVSKKQKALFYIMVAAIFIHSFGTVSYLFKRLNNYYLMYLLIYLPEIFKPSNSYAFSIDTYLRRYFEPVKTKLGEKISFVRNIDTMILLQRILLVGIVLVLSVYYVVIIPQDYYGLLPYGTNFQEFDYVLDRWE